MTEAKRRIVILTEGLSNPINAKTAVSVIRYRTEEVVAVLDSTVPPQTTQRLFNVGGNIPVVPTLAHVPAADTLLIGIAPQGGKLPQAMRAAVLQAIQRGMEIQNGLHEFLSDDPEFAAAARQHNARLVDLRRNDEHDVARRQNLRPDCLRVHTVGNDCCVGKMVVAIEVTHGLKAHGVDAKFLATGQTGILIEGHGCPVDAVVSDFVNGAVEKLVLAHQHHEVLLIEGQGSLIHPAYSAVTMGLLHGCAPHALILCYEMGRTHVNGLDHIPLLPLDQLIALYHTVANVAHPCRFIGVAINSRRVSDAQYREERARVERELNLPACDIFRDSAAPLVEAVQSLRTASCN
ncbi:MAG: DUF1611 domain-containing protein [Pedosphaera sp.]|nr:DUF1611 domain-containing protein [Pedosphaera sp.]